MQGHGMKHVMAKFVLQLLLPEQKEHRAAFANDLFQTSTNEPDFLKNVIARNKLWVYCYDTDTEAQLYLVPYIFFNKCLYFSYYMAEYFLSRTCISSDYEQSIILSHLFILTNLIMQYLYEVVTIIIHILQTGKLRHR